MRFEGLTLYDSVHDLLVWQRIARREARDLLMRHRAAGPDAPLITVPQAGAELLCPTCSSEARPDDADTATCGSCGTLSPLDATVSTANQIHQSLHYALRVRGSLIRGDEDHEVPSSFLPIPRLAARVGSMIVLASMSGMRLSQLEEMITGQKSMLQRWVRKEHEEGDPGLVGAIPDRATAIEIVEAVLEHSFPQLREGFPPRADAGDALGRAHAAIGQYHKFRSSSSYVAFLVDALLIEERMRLGLSVTQAVPWEELSALIHALRPNTPAPLDLNQRARAGEEALVDATAAFLRQKIGLVQHAAARHRAVVAALA